MCHGAPVHRAAGVVVAVARGVNSLGVDTQQLLAVDSACYGWAVLVATACPALTGGEAGWCCWRAC